MSSWSPYPNLWSMRKQPERVRMDFTKGKSCSGKLIAFCDSIGWKKVHLWLKTGQTTGLNSHQQQTDSWLVGNNKCVSPVWYWGSHHSTSGQWQRAHPQQMHDTKLGGVAVVSNETSIHRDIWNWILAWVNRNLMSSLRKSAKVLQMGQNNPMHRSSLDPTGWRAAWLGRIQVLQWAWGSVWARRSVLSLQIREPLCYPGGKMANTSDRAQ